MKYEVWPDVGVGEPELSGDELLDWLENTWNPPTRGHGTNAKYLFNFRDEPDELYNGQGEAYWQSQRDCYRVDFVEAGDEWIGRTVPLTSSVKGILPYEDTFDGYHRYGGPDRPVHAAPFMETTYVRPDRA